jgi:pyruvate formate lyase activating enzyme
MKGLIFDIKRFAIHDGPGIRTTVFFKGCPLSCDWCHNPESRSCHIESYIEKERVGNVAYNAEKQAGKYYTNQELIQEVKKDMVFYDESKGGVTCSGGEPLYQPGFLQLFLEASKAENLHTCVDTSGYAHWKKLKNIIPFTDLFLYDIKHLDAVSHKDATGVDNSTILRNLEKLVAARSKVQIRFPLIPGFNDKPKHIEDLINFIANNLQGEIEGIILLPYHDLGSSKYGKFGISRKGSYSEPDTEIIKKLVTTFKENKINVLVGG